MDFLKEIRLHKCKLIPNSLRVVLGTSKINRRYNVNLGLIEIKHYYSLAIHDSNYNLKARPNCPSIVEGFSSSHKGYYSDIIVITGDVEPDPTN